MIGNLSDMMDLINLEYNEANVGSARYFDNLYRTIQAYLIAIVALVILPLEKVDGAIYVFLFLLLIPCLTYIFGLFYCYNGYAIAKIACFQKQCEGKLRILSTLKYKSNVYYGWTYFVAKKKDSFILAYGTFLVFFLLIPIACIVLGLLKLDRTNVKMELIIPKTPFHWSILILSVCLYLIYFSFMLKIIIDTKRMIALRNTMSVDYHIEENGGISFLETNDV